jgi:Xaa-Pro aminopeptidase
VHPYIGYTVDEPLDCTKRMAIELGEMLKPFGSLKGKVGVEMNQMPAALFARLQEALPKAQLVSLDRQLDAMRAVKSPEEIKKIRAALHLADLAQFELVKHIRPGITELELWTLVKSKVELEAGCRVPVLVDLVAGTRTAEIGGPPGDYALQDGDPVMLDFVPRLDGYWGDNCAGYFVGEPGRALQKVYEAVKGCLQASAEAIKPGMRANELDAKLRAYIRQAGFEPYPHHSGHGLGATFHDEPRIVPNHAVRLEPGMVLVLEPGIYLSGVGGVRLEDAYLVTADGCEVLTTHLSQS